MTCNAMGWQGILQFNQNFILAFTKKTGWVIFSQNLWHKQKFRIKNIPVNDLREMWPINNDSQVSMWNVGLWEHNSTL